MVRGASLGFHSSILSLSIVLEMVVPPKCCT